MTDEPITHTSVQPPIRPLSVTLLAFGVLSITVLGFLRGYLAIRDWRFLASWPGVSPLYLAATGILVGLLGAIVFWALASRKRYAMRLTEAAMLALALGYWLDQIFVAEHPFSDPAGTAKAFLPVNWPFAAAVTAMVFLSVEIMRRSARVKAYFGEENE
jgi:hypothetical protein